MTAAADAGAAGDAANTDVDAASEMTEAAKIDLNIPVPSIRLVWGRASPMTRASVAPIQNE
jgi:hypothetical protein